MRGLLFGALITAFCLACSLDRSPIKPGELSSGPGTGRDPGADPDAAATDASAGSRTVTDAGSSAGSSAGDASRDATPAASADAGPTGGPAPGQDAAQDAAQAPALDTAQAAAQDAGLDGEPPAEDDAGAGPDDAGEDAGDDAGDKQPEENFGLSCAGVLCPSVTAPAMQCCTQPEDALARRARGEALCGVAREGAAGCAQLQQLGVIDSACPAATPEGSSLEQPGCCTDRGRCGSFDSEHGIGCHENPEVDQACGEDEVEPGESCDLTGVYAIKAHVDVAWGGQSGALFELTDDGRGVIEVTFRVRIDEVDAEGGFVGRVLPCGAGLPPFRSSLLCEAYQPVFPDVIWDEGQQIELDASGRFQCQGPGCLLSIDPTTVLVGIELTNPEAAWPIASESLSFSCGAQSGVACYPDYDLDTNPGVTVRLPRGPSLSASDDCDSGYAQRGAPLNSNPLAVFGGVARTDRLHLGVRIRLGAAGRVSEDCRSAQGQGVAEFVQSRAAGCMLEPGSSNPFRSPAGPNQPCSADELSFVNQSLPVYEILRVGQRPSWRLSLSDRSVSRGPTYQIIRLGDSELTASCRDVRAAF